MKVCAHINSGPFTNSHEYFDSIDAAENYFREFIIDSPYRSGVTDDDGCYVMDIYPRYSDGQSCACDSAMNFHDYPMVRLSVGKFGGLHRER